MTWAALAIAIAAAVAKSRAARMGLLVTWVEQWRKLTRKHVKDKQRRAQIMAIVDAESESLAGFLAEVGDALQDMYGVHSNYDATADDYAPCIERVVQSFAEIQASTVAATYELQPLLDSEEAAAIHRRIDKDLARYWSKRDRADAKASKRER